MNIKTVLRILAWLCIGGGVAVWCWTIHGVLVGSLELTSRSKSIGVLYSQSPGAFIILALVYAGCGGLFVWLGLKLLSEDRKKQ